MLESDDLKIVWRPLAGSQTLALSCPAHIILYHGSRGPGKGLPVDEPVFTPTGPKPIGSLQVGDLVSCPDGTTSPVIGVYPQGLRPTYELEFFDGSIARCDDQHIWNLHVGGRTPAGTYKNYTMQEVLRMFRTTNYRLNVPTLDEINIGESPVFQIDPYTMGLFLGDGSSAQRGSYCTVDNELAQHVIKNGFRETLCDQRNGLRNFSCETWFTEEMRSLGLTDVRSKTKFVPKIYLNADSYDRLAILQGLMDTDGTIDKKGYITFTSGSLQLAKDVQYLSRSLGARATLTEKIPTIDGVVYDKAYNVYIQTAGKFVPFRLDRKVARIRPYMHENLTNKIVAIRELGLQETVCIKIAHAAGLFVTRDFVVTHNTDAQLMRFRRHVGQGYGSHWRGIIFDRQYKNLDDLVAKSMRWFPEFKDGAKFLASKSDYRWVWPTGEQLLFRAVSKDSDYWSYHGQEFPFIGWNELTKYSSPTLFEAMMSCNRTSFRPQDFPLIIDGDHFNKTGQVITVGATNPNAQEYLLPDLPLEVFATCNPHGVGHNWVKKRFINVSPMGRIHKKSIRVFNPRTQREEDVVKTQVHLFGSYRENIYLPPEYIAELASITDKNKREAWLKGNWDIIAGGMFDDKWDSFYHVIEPFEIPSSWSIQRTFDWGSSKPFSVGWWAVSDGTDFATKDGKRFSTIRGDAFRISEWYGADKTKPNTGLNMLNAKIAEGIVRREMGLKLGTRVEPGPADGSIFDVVDGNSIARTMQKNVTIDGRAYPGVIFTRADKSPGSRISGWDKCRERLENALPYTIGENGEQIPRPRERPGIYIFNTCTDFIDLVPVLPRDEDNMDDVDSDAEDHIGDEFRYFVLGQSTGARVGKTHGT